MFMHWENTHVLAIVEAMLIFWELTCVLSVVHWITWGNERNFRQCGPLSGSLYYNLTTTQQKDMHDLSNTWRHAGKERDTLQTWQPWWSTVWPLPIKRHVWSINHLETCWQGAWHSPNMAAMVVHCQTSTHQEDMHALSTIWRHAGKEHDTLQTWQPWWSTVWPLPIKRTCMPYQPPGDMGARSVTLQTWQPWWSTVWPLPIKRTCMPYQPPGDMLASTVGWAM